MAGASGFALNERQSANMTNYGSRSASGFVSALLSVSLGAFGEAAEDGLRELRNVATAYKIEIIVAAPRFPVMTPFGTIDGKKARDKSLERYANLFAREFGLYPPDLVKRSRLKRVVLCERLSYSGQRRNAIPDFEQNALYLDVSRGSYSEPYLRGVIHHEFFHIIDYRDDGSVYQDRQWEVLNPADFKYGGGGRTVQDLATTSVLTDKYPGFLNHYSTTGVEEDKAEVYANLIVNPIYVENRTKADRVLKAKVELMRKLLARFCTEMNEGFWEKVKRRK